MLLQNNFKAYFSFPWVYRHNKPEVFNQSESAHYLSYFIKKQYADDSYIITHLSILCIIGDHLKLRFSRSDKEAYVVLRKLLEWKVWT